MHTLKPLDEEAVLQAAFETKAVVTIQEHSIVGALGSAVAELLAETDGVRAVFRRIGIPPRFSPRTGTQQFLLAENGLDLDAIIEKLKGLLDRSARSAVT